MHIKQKKRTHENHESLLSCGGPTRTNDLWVMSPTSYHCSTPRYFVSAKILLFCYETNFYCLNICFDRCVLGMLHYISSFDAEKKIEILCVDHPESFSIPLRLL